MKEQSSLTYDNLFTEDCSQANGPLLSILTPVYNPPVNNLQRCARSILEQPYRSIEWILADDGSNPATLRFLQELAGRDARINLLFLKHGGASSARNSALEHAKGDYITFVDADDEVTPTFFSHAIENLISTSSDAILGRTVYVHGKGTVNTYAFDNANGYRTRSLTGKELEDFKRFLVSSRPVKGEDYFGIKPGSIAPRVYTRKLIGNKRFCFDMSYGEDSLFGYNVMSNAQKISIADEVWYIYVCNSSSATSSITVHQYEKHLDSLSLLYSRVLDDGCSESDASLKCATGLQALSFELASSVPFLRFASIFRSSARKLRTSMHNIAVKDYELSTHARFLYGSLSHGLILPATLLLWAKGMRAKKHRE